MSDHEIVLPPKPVKIAYLIDPLMALSLTMQEQGRPCRVDGEVDGGDFWKEKHPAFLRRVPPEGLR